MPSLLSIPQLGLFCLFMIYHRWCLEGYIWKNGMFFFLYDSDSGCCSLVGLDKRSSSNEQEKQAVEEEVKFVRSQYYCVCFVYMLSSADTNSAIEDLDNIR